MVVANRPFVRPTSATLLRSAPEIGAGIGARLAGIFGWPRTIEKTSALDIQIAETLDLKPIGQNTKQEMARQVRGRPPPKHVMQTGLKRSNVEIA